MADRKMALMKGEIREPLSPISANKATARTPHKRTASRNATARTPGNKTPNIKKSGAGTEGSMYDRFIPNRSLMNVQVSYYCPSFFLNKMTMCKIFNVKPKGI